MLGIEDLVSPPLPKNLSDEKIFQTLLCNVPHLNKITSKY